MNKLNPKRAGLRVFAIYTIYRTANKDGTPNPDGRIVLNPDVEEGPLTLLYRPGDEVPDEVMEMVANLDGENVGG